MGGGGGGGGGRGGTSLPEMSSDVPFTERTADGDDAMEIKREEIAEAEVAAIAEEE